MIVAMSVILTKIDNIPDYITVIQTLITIQNDAKTTLTTVKTTVATFQTTGTTVQRAVKQCHDKPQQRNNKLS
jgi:hypothetical protein